MEFTNLIFGVLIGAVIISGLALFYTNVNANYPSAPQLNSNITAEFNTEANHLNATIGTATGQASEFGTSDNALALAFGYLLGAFNAILSLVSTPQMFLGMIGGVGQMMGIFFPVFLMQYLVTAVATITVLGLLFYWLKVR
jgi:hypothetical protein